MATVVGEQGSVRKEMQEDDSEQGFVRREIKPADGPFNFLQAIVEKTQGDPKILILSMGDREGGSKRPRMVERWAKCRNFEYEFYGSNPWDNGPKTGDLQEKDAIQQFFNKHKQTPWKVVIFQQGHASSKDGSWKGQGQGQGRITPAEVYEMAGRKSEITIVTGCCYGGHWLEYFEGLSAAPPHLKNRGQGRFWFWLFKELDDGEWPIRDPNHRGLGKARYRDAHGKPNVF